MSSAPRNARRKARKSSHSFHSFLTTGLANPYKGPARVHANANYGYARFSQGTSRGAERLLCSFQTGRNLLVQLKSHATQAIKLTFNAMPKMTDSRAIGFFANEAAPSHRGYSMRIDYEE
jgi:hypothetical protein